MPKIKTKKELLSAIENEYHLLKEIIRDLDAKQMQTPGVCDKWSIKDLVAHLVAWKLMFLGWYRRGLKGENFQTPADDLKWNQTPILNERIYQQWKDEPLEKVLRDFETTHTEMVKLTNSLPEEQLFQMNLYPWMRTTLLVRWIDAQTSMHYRWARNLIRKWKNSQKSMVRDTHKL
jgi:hypothetical protein